MEAGEEGEISVGQNNMGFEYFSSKWNKLIQSNWSSFFNPKQNILLPFVLLTHFKAPPLSIYVNFKPKNAILSFNKSYKAKIKGFGESKFQNKISFIKFTSFGVGFLLGAGRREERHSINLTKFVLAREFSVCQKIHSAPLFECGARREHMGWNISFFCGPSRRTVQFSCLLVCLLVFCFLKNILSSKF